MRQRPASLVIHVSLSLLISLFLLSAVSLRTAAQTPQLDAEEQAFLTLINNYRAQNGAGPLKASIALTNAAKWMSGDMAAKNYFPPNHVDSLGRSAFARITSFGYPPNSLWGENIAGGNSTAAGTFNQWKNSPAHNQNMLNPSHKVIGIGRAFGSGSNFRWYWTTDFGNIVDATLDTSSIVPPPTATTVNAASFLSTIAPDAIAATFGSNLAAGTYVAPALPLPTILGGVTVTINGVAAQLLYVSPTQINFVVPASVSAGAATVTVTSNGIITAQGTAAIAAVSPSFFTASANGQGVPVGFTTFDGVFYSPIFNANGSAQPLGVGTDANPNYLILFGTGFRLRSSLSNVQVLIGGVAAAVQYAGPQSNFAGLDQLNVKLPVSLRGRGEVPLVLIIDDRVANSVRINIGN